jgi:hypothetical protein
MSAMKPEVEITFKRKEMAKRFQRLPHILDHVRLTVVLPTWPSSQTQNVGHQTRSDFGIGKQTGILRFRQDFRVAMLNTRTYRPS